MTIETPRERFGSIQCLRGIAALMVVAYHLSMRMERADPRWSHIDVLMAGVDIFFVISGFIMWVTTCARPERTPVEFLRDRIIRIAPPYWLITAAIVAVILLSPKGASGNGSGAEIGVPVTNLQHVVTSFLFVASEHPGKGVYHPVLIAGWTLNLEMFFYLIFAAAMLVAGTNMRRRAALIFLTLGSLVLVGRLAHAEDGFGFYTQDLLLEFGAGVALGAIYTRGWVKTSKLWWLAVAAGVVALTLWIEPRGYPRAVEWGIPALSIVAGAVFAPDFAPSLLQRLGDWSYSLYLTHQVTLAVAQKAWLALGLGPLILFAVVAIIVSIAASGLFYYLAERPMTRFLSTRARRTRVIPAHADVARGPVQAATIQKRACDV